MVLLVLVGCIYYGIHEHRSAIAGLAVVTVTLLAGLTASFAIFPTKNIINLLYLDVVLWPAGILWWLVTGWVACDGFAILLLGSPKPEASGQPAMSGANGPGSTVVFVRVF